MINSSPIPPTYSTSLSILAESRLFYGLDEAALTAVFKYATIRKVSAGGFFFHEGEPSNTFFIVISGMVRLLQTTSAGKQVIIHLCGPRQGISLIAISRHERSPASAEAVKDSSAYAWDSVDLRHLMEIYPRIALNSVDILTSRLLRTQDMYRELATERVEQRVAHTILRLAEQEGVQTGTGIRIDIPLTREDIAQMSGTTLYTVSRVLTKWERAGLVHTGRQYVEVSSRQGMKDIADDSKC